MTFQTFWSSIFLVFSFAVVNYVESQRAPEGCYGVMDVIVAIDGSDSINLRDYKKLRKSMETFVEELDISKDAIHLAFVVYSSTIADETDLSYDKAYLKHFASGLIHPRRATNTHLALEEMRLIHERKIRKDVPSVGLLFTDGISRNKTKTLVQAKLLRDAGIVLYAVGISNILDFTELRSIAPNRTLKFDSYKQLLDHIKAFVKYICQKCDSPPPIRNAISPRGEFIIGSLANYKCRIGYFQTGTPTIKCLTDKRWGPTDFACRRNCQIPMNIQYAAVTYDGTLEGDTAKYTCKAGTEPDGDNTIICQGNGRWSRTAFRCRVNCGTPRPIPRAILLGPVSIEGQIVGVGTYVGDEREYKCEPNMVMQGDPRIRCQKDGSWSKTDLKCLPNCGNPKTIPGTTYTLLKGVTTEGASAEYRCLQGIKGRGTPTITCQANGKWTTTNFRCIPDCGEPIEIDGADVDDGDSTEGSIRRYTCRENYDGTGSPEIECLQSGDWSKSDFSCRRNCGKPPYIPGAELDVGGTLEGDTRKYMCGKRFYPKGDNDKVTCQGDGEWSECDLKCIPNCFDPPSIIGAYVNEGGTLEGDERVYTCDAVYQGIGSPNIWCQENGQWSNLELQCIPNCFDPPSIYGAEISGGGTLYGDERTYVCGEKYHSKGNPKVTCQENRKWSASDFECIPNCGNPPDIQGTDVMYSGTLVADRATYVCPQSTVQEGEMSIECQKDGEWSHSNFYCRPKCGEPPHVIGAKVQDGGILEADERTYRCEETRHTEGNPKIICQKNGEWSDPDIKCIPKCGIPPYKPGTEIEYTGTVQGDRATYVCPSTSVAEGETTIICQDDGKWSHTDIYCKAKCEEPPFVYGATIDEGGSLEGDERIYTCGETYYEKGNSHIRCQKDGHWSRPEVECIPNCGVPRPIAGTIVEYTGTLKDDQATYICPLKTVPEGETTITCQDDGHWSNTDINCRPKCEEPPVVYGAKVSDGESLEGDERIYTCGEIYYQKGNSKIWCQDDGEWSIPEVECIPNCGIPQDKPGMEVQYSGTLQGDHATYVCPPTSVAEGETTIICKDDGKWSQTNIQCRRLKVPVSPESRRYFNLQANTLPIGNDDYLVQFKFNKAVKWRSIHCSTKCEEPPVVYGAKVSDGESLEGDERIYTCGEMYYQKGNSKIWCQDDGEWSIPEVECIPNCGIPQDKPGMEVQYSGTLQGDHATYVCPPTSVAEGETTIICKDDGKWRQTNIKCRPKCDEPPVVYGASVSDGESLEGDERIYTCGETYYQKGNSKILCQDDGKWSNPEVECIPNCGIPQDIPGMEVQYSGTLKDDHATYVCPSTSVAEGETTIICQDNGQWSHTNIHCRPNCEEPPSIHGATISDGDSLEGDERVYTCGNKYYAKGNSKIWCQEDGKWSKPELECIPNCGNPSDIFGTKVHYTGTLVGDRATYICPATTETEGENTIICQENGEWSRSNIYCRPNCDEPPSVYGATVSDGDSLEGDERTYTCGDIYHAEGDNKVVCQDNGEWSQPNIKCIPNCFEPPSIFGAEVSEGGTLHGDERVYTCGEKYYAKDNSKIKCQENGKWSETTLQCIPNCGDPPRVSNTEVTYTGTLQGDEATYTCPQTTVAEGEDTIVCQDNGKWTDPNINCRMICDKLPSIKGATVGGGGNLHGDERIFTCGDIYYAEGDPKTVCQENGKWTVPNLICIPNCYDPPFITGAIVSDGGSLYGDERDYTCEEKHHATGNPKIRCQETGQWSSSDFECIPNCGEPPYVQDTEMLYTGTLRGDTVTYVCPPTTVPEGQMTIKCLDNGEWSQTKISCRPNCNDPPLIYGASVNQGGTLQGDERVYTCKENYQSKGNPMIICQKDGHWSASGIECRRICEVPMNIPFASVKYSGTLEGDKAVYTCDKGRKPEGNNVIECQKDGSWSKTGFKCKVECAAPKSVLHTKLVDNKDTFTIEGMTVQPKSYEGDERAYECVPDTVMEGDPRIRCQADGSWTATNFYCRPNCYEPPHVDGASVSLGGTMEGDQRTYVCGEGFTSWGNGTVVCQENGHWSECNLKCIPKCRSPPAIPGTSVAITGTEVGSTGVYTCLDNTVAEGNAYILCQESGQWTKSDIKCRPKCRSPPAIPGTSIEITGAEVGSTGVYTCLDNTVAEGNAKIICQENGQWSISDIKCRRDCGNPPAVPFTTISSGGTLQRDERTYSCSNNMAPVGNTTIRCQDNGRWSQIEFHCRRSCKPGSYNCRVTEYGNRPPTNDYGNRPLTNNYGNRPPTNDYGNRPPTNDYGNRPPTNDYGNRPPSNDYGNRHKTNDYGNRPPLNDNGNRPPTNTYGNRPPTSTYGNRSPTNDYGNRQAIGSGNKQTNDNGKRQTINSENNRNRIPNSNIDLLRRRLTGRTGYAPPKTVVRENRYDSGTQSGESSAINEGHIASSESPVNKNNYNDVKQVSKRKSTKQDNNKIKQSGDKSKVDPKLNPRLAFLKRREKYLKSDRSKLKSFFRKYMTKALSRRKKPASSD